jgi:hypothetical protein
MILFDFVRKVFQKRFSENLWNIFPENNFFWIIIKQMSGFAGRFSLGGVFCLSSPIQHFVPMAKTGMPHMVEVALNSPVLYRAKPLDGLVAMYSLHYAEIVRELGGHPILVEADSFSKDYLHNCLIVTRDFTESVVYQKSKSPNIKMATCDLKIAQGNFWVLHVRPLVIHVGRTKVDFLRKRVPKPFCDLSGAECIICCKPYDNDKNRRVQVCALPCAEGFNCLECYKALKDQKTCSVCRQSANPALCELENLPSVERTENSIWKIQNFSNNEMAGWLGRHFCDHQDFYFVVGIALMRRVISKYPSNETFQDLSGVSVVEMEQEFQNCYSTWSQLINFQDFYGTHDADLLKGIKSLLADEDARLKLVQDCGRNPQLRTETCCKGYLSRMKKNTVEVRLAKLESMKNKVIHVVKTEFTYAEKILGKFPSISRHEDYQVIQL